MFWLGMLVGAGAIVLVLLGIVIDTFVNHKL